MSDLISRSALIEEIEKPKQCIDYGNALLSKSEIKAIINKQPTVEAVPVVHGEWKFNHFYDEWECSECGSLIALSDDENGHPNFCPNCGADMRGVK